MKCNKTFLITSIILIFLIILSCIIFLGIILYRNKPTYFPKSIDCPPIFDLIQTFLEEQISDQWHWSYVFDFSYFGYRKINSKIQMKCPTANYEPELYIDDKLIASSNIELSLNISKNTIRDCHGNIIYITRTSNKAEYLFDSNGMRVSYELRDKDDYDILGYIRDIGIFYDSFEIKDTYYNRSMAGFSKVYNVDHRLVYVYIYTGSYTNPVADVRVISMLIGEQLFKKSYNNSDGCNQYYNKYYGKYYGKYYDILLCILLFLIAVDIGLFGLYKIINK